MSRCIFQNITSDPKYLLQLHTQDPKKVFFVKTDLEMLHHQNLYYVRNNVVNYIRLCYKPGRQSPEEFVYDKLAFFGVVESINYGDETQIEKRKAIKQKQIATIFLEHQAIIPSDSEAINKVESTPVLQASFDSKSPIKRVETASFVSPRESPVVETPIQQPLAPRQAVAHSAAFFKDVDYGTQANLTEKTVKTGLNCPRCCVIS